LTSRYLRMICDANWSAARRHLNRDPVMCRIIKQSGPCKLARRRDYFPFLCKAIFNQQLSGKIAKILFARFCEHFPRKTPTPQRTIQLLSRGHKVRRAVGLSKQKQKYLVDLGRTFPTAESPRAN